MIPTMILSGWCSGAGGSWRLPLGRCCGRPSWSSPASSASLTCSVSPLWEHSTLLRVSRFTRLPSGWTARSAVIGRHRVLPSGPCAIKASRLHEAEQDLYPLPILIRFWVSCFGTLGPDACRAGLEL